MPVRITMRSLQGRVLGIAMHFPEIVDVDVGPPVIDESAADHSSAAAFTFSAVTADAKQFQLFQPIAGVRPICVPQTILNFCVAEPSAFLADSVTRRSPSDFKPPVIRPVVASSFNPLGNPRQRILLAVHLLPPR